jgi:hypothetical protein
MSPENHAALLFPKEDKTLRGPTFKNSLRSWQARWKEQKVQAGDAGGPNTAAPAGRDCCNPAHS